MQNATSLSFSGQRVTLELSAELCISRNVSGSKRFANECFCRADATISGEATGAMSWAFINALKKNPQQSYVQLLNSIREELRGKYDQKPQLSCSHPLGMIDSASSRSSRRPCTNL